jgi:CHAD domain-containing protein/adenylate cyclase class IV
MAEVEAKFLIRSNEQVNQVLATLDDLGYLKAERETATHVDTYFDTPDFDTLRAGWTYRCRQRGGRNTLTLKSCGTHDGQVFVREEIEQALPDEYLSLIYRLPPGPVQKYLDSIIDTRRNRKLFRVESERRVFAVTSPGREPSQIELDLDRTRITAATAKDKAPGSFEFMELELELESGNTDAVDQLAMELLERLGLTPAQFSKFDRGIQAAGFSLKHLAMRQEKPSISETDPLLDLIYLHFGRQLIKLKKHQPIAWEGLDPEGVHKMRVAIRRIRTILKEYRKVLGKRVVKPINKELRWLFKQLGEARDADVGEMAIREFTAALPADAARAATPYEDHVRQRTVDAYANITAVFVGERYRKLIESLEEFVAAGPHEAMKKNAGDLTIAEAADRDIHKSARRMIKRGDRIIAESLVEKLHRLRIEAKHLRYLLDFFSVAQPVRWKDSIVELEKLQDLLGWHQDAIMSQERLEAYDESLATTGEELELRLSIDHLISTEHDRLDSCRRKFPLAWREFKTVFERPTFLLSS